jgi:hypothetical protein
MKARFSSGSGILPTMWWLWFFGCIADKSVVGEDADTGEPVLVVADSGMAFDSGEVSWVPLDESAQWVSRYDGYGTGGGFADIDGDGDEDLVVAHGNDMSPGHLVVFENRNGSLTQEPTWVNRTPAYYGHLALGDVNNDGWVDVAVSRFLGNERFDEPGGVEVYLNRSGLLEDTPSWEANGFFTFSVALGDMDNDGALDLAVAVGESYENEPGENRVFAGDGSGGFGEEPVWVAPEPAYSFDVQWADFDGDGWLELAFARQQDGHIIYDNDEGVLSAAALWEADAVDGPFEGNTLDIGDVDNDGRVDLVVSDNNQLGGAGLVRLWCGPALSLCWSVHQDYASAVSLFDWDGDGDLDLAYGGWWSPVFSVENSMGILNTEPAWVSDKDDIVVEALDWANLNGSAGAELMVTDWTESSGNRVWGR